MRILGATPWPTLIAAGVLVFLVSAVFFPILGFEFVDYDVRQQVLDNRYVHGLSAENLKHIVTSRCVTSYYPVRTLTFAVDYQLWGLDPLGFKLTNCLIHLANVLLVYWLVLRLLRHPGAGGESPDGWRDVCVAASSAGLFAVHPVVVEPVAWVAGREELLMLLGTLGCVHFHITARRLDEEHAKRWRATACYVGAALCCLAACLSNAVAAVIPLLIVAWDVLTLTAPKLWRIVCGTSALWLMSVATIVVKKPGFGSNSLPGEVAVLSAQRLALVLNVYWLNLKSLVRPTSLAVEYPDVTPESFLDAGVILGVIAVGLTCAALWISRRRSLILYGLVWFCLALGPTSQIMPHHIMRADRFLYLPLVGIAIVLALAVGRFLQNRRGAGNVLGVGLAVSVIVLLIGLTSRQLQTWRNSVSLWEQCVRVCSTNGVGYANLADALAEEGRFEQARPIFEKALELDPHNPHSMATFAYRLSMCRDERLRDYERAIPLATRACQIVGWRIPEYRRILSTAYMNWATDLSRAGQFEPAIQSYQAAIRADPDYEAATFNLALLLASCEDDRLRDPVRAVQLAKEAAEAGGGEPLHLSILAEVYANVGRLDEAALAIEKAILSAEEAGDSEMLDALANRLEQLRRVSTTTID